MIKLANLDNFEVHAPSKSAKRQIKYTSESSFPIFKQHSNINATTISHDSGFVKDLINHLLT